MLGNSINEKMQTLGSKLERLSCREADINEMLEQAEFQPGKRRKREVENWLGNVEKKRREFLSLEQDVKQRGILSNSGLGKRADNMIREIEELVEQGQFSEGLLLDVHETKGEPLLTTKLIGEAFQNNLQKILDCLKKDELLSIGIYGMGGAGKTTLATHIHKLLSEKSDHTFDHVYWVTVSHDLSIHKLQNDIAKAVNLDLSDVDDVRRRAARLSQALIRRKKCVLILDDVWHHLRLEEVGICPMVNGCKLILTTRFLDVCHRMGCRENIKVDSLPEKESWDLFRETLGHGLALPPDIENIAMSVAKRCGGLPLGITVMAGSMRGVNDICEWKNVLEELEESASGQRDMEDEVFPLLKLSYDRLKDARLQDCFLYCALYPEDRKIKRDELIIYFIAEGLIDRRKSMQAKLYMGHTLLNKLERACLLESCKNYEGKRYVKMHDLMREMALRVSPRFMVKAGLQLDEIPDEQEWMEDLDKVSLMKNDFREEIPPGTAPRCHRLSTLLFQENNILRWIPYSFFVHMPALRVLDLSSTGICDLPEYISELESLTALFLQYCYKLKYVPPLGKLRALQMLNLSGTKIEEVPQGMEMLVNLNCLYMEDMGNMRLMLPSGILPRLSHLQVLILGSVRIEEVEEVKELKLLEELKCELYELCDLNRFVKSQCFRRLRIYHLILGDFHYLKEEDYDYDKEVRIGYGRDMVFQLPHDIQRLHIEGCHGFNSLCDVSPSLNKLKKCEICRCDGIDMPKLKSICKGVMACDSIEKIALHECPELKRVPFSLPLFFNGQPSPTPHALKEIQIDEEWWESLEWDHPNAKNVLQPFLKYSWKW